MFNKISKIFLTTMFLLAIASESCLADYTFSTVEPAQPALYGNYYQNPYYGYSQTTTNPYYYNGQYQNPTQNTYQNPYWQRNYAAYNPYATNPYYNQNLVGVNGVKNQIIRNVGQNIMYSMLRGY